MLAKDKQFLILIRHSLCYSYIESNPVKSLGSDRGKKNIYVKVKDPLSFEIWIFCKVKQSCDDDRRIFAAMSST